MDLAWATLDKGMLMGAMVGIMVMTILGMMRKG